MDALLVLAALAGLTVAIGQVVRYLPAESGGALLQVPREEKQ